jgi:hypothetical protein
MLQPPRVAQHWGRRRQPPGRYSLRVLAADRRQPFVNRAAIRSWQRPAPCAVRRLPAGTHTQSASDGAGCSQKGILRVPAGCAIMPCKDTNRRNSARLGRHPEAERLSKGDWLRRRPAPAQDLAQRCGSPAARMARSAATAWRSSTLFTHDFLNYRSGARRPPKFPWLKLRRRLPRIAPSAADAMPVSQWLRALNQELEVVLHPDRK